MAWSRPRLLPSLLLPSSETVFLPLRLFSSVKDGVSVADKDGGNKIVEPLQRKMKPSTTTTTTVKEDDQWPLLKRNKKTEQVQGTNFSAMFIPNVSPPKVATEKPMLIIHGLSPYLYPLDFHRLGSGGWQPVIKQVQPLRDPSTLEPDVLGRYYVTFTTETAATSYRDNLDRLHRLARHKMLSPAGIWQTRPPPDIAASAKPDQVESLTILAASQPLHVSYDQVKKRKAWIESLVRITTALGYSYPSDDKPRVILLRVYPPNLETAALQQLIQKDSPVRKCSWRVSKPFLIEKDLGSEPDDNDELRLSVPLKRAEPLEGQRRRFALACDSENEAHRFQRHWNQRTLFTDKEMGVRHVFHATVIHW